MAALSLAMVAPYLVFIQLNGGLERVPSAGDGVGRRRARADACPVARTLRQSRRRVGGGAQGAPLQRAVAVVRDNRVAWLYYFEIALPILALLVVGLSRDAFRPGWPHAIPKIAVVAILGLILDAGFLRSPLQARVADPSVPHAILLAWLAAALPRLLSSSLVVEARGAAHGPCPFAASPLLAAIAIVFVLGSIFTQPHLRPARGRVSHRGAAGDAGASADRQPERPD